MSTSCTQRTLPSTKENLDHTNRLMAGQKAAWPIHSIVTSRKAGTNNRLRILISDPLSQQAQIWHLCTEMRRGAHQAIYWLASQKQWVELMLDTSMIVNKIFNHCTCIWRRDANEALQSLNSLETYVIHAAVYHRTTWAERKDLNSEY